MTSPKPLTYRELSTAALDALDVVLATANPGTADGKRRAASAPMVLAQLATAAAINELTEQLRAQAHNPTVVVR